MSIIISLAWLLSSYTYYRFLGVFRWSELSFFTHNNEHSKHWIPIQDHKIPRLMTKEYHSHHNIHFYIIYINLNSSIHNSSCRGAFMRFPFWGYYCWVAILFGGNREWTQPRKAPASRRSVWCFRGSNRSPPHPPHERHPREASRARGWAER